MKRLFAVAIMLIALVGCTRVGPGHVGIKVNLAGSDRGVDSTNMTTGWVFYNPLSTSIREYPTFVQTAQWTADKNEGSDVDEHISFSSKEGIPFDADISASFHLNSFYAPYFYNKYKADDIATFTHGYAKNIIRDFFNEVAGQMSSDDIMGPKKDSLVITVRKRLNGAFLTTDGRIGIEWDQLGFIGNVRPPRSLIDAISLKQQATQAAIAAENTVREAEAKAHQAAALAQGVADSILIIAKANAEANRIINSSVNRDILLWQAIQKWNGVRPNVEGAGSGGVLVNLPNN